MFYDKGAWLSYIIMIMISLHIPTCSCLNSLIMSIKGERKKLENTVKPKSYI